MDRYKTFELPLTIDGTLPRAKEALFNNVTHEIARIENAPLELAMQAVLGAASLAYSSHINVKYPLGGIEPIQSNFIAIASSGIGKGRVSNRANYPIKAFEKENAFLYKERLKEHQCEFLIWQDEKNMIRKSKRDTDYKVTELYLHESNKPKPPTEWRITLEDTTPLAALQKAEKIPIIGIISSEGRNFLNPRNMSETEKYCSLWSDEDVTVNRQGYTLEVSGTKPTISVMIQPGAFEKFMDKKADEFTDSGFAARTCFSYFHERNLSHGISNNNQAELTHLQEYYQRIGQALNDTKTKFESESKEETTLSFSKPAEAKWFRTHDEIKKGMNPQDPNARFNKIEEHASRLMQIITRTAALIHCLNGEQCEISLNTLEEAIEIGAWYSNNYKALFVKPPQSILDAQILDQWLNQYRVHNFRSFIRKNFIRQNGPNSLRQKDRLENALFILQTNLQIRPFVDGKTTWLNLLPASQQDLLPLDLKEQPQYGHSGRMAGLIPSPTF